MRKKGQMFILSALIFASFILLTAYSLDGFVDGGKETFFRGYFSNSMENPAEAFEKGIEESGETGDVKKEVYNARRFIERQSKAKGIDYRGIDYFILPSQQEAVLVNYGDSLIYPSVKIDGSWHNNTLKSYQSLKLSFSSEELETRIVVDSLNIDESFNAYNPRIFTWSQMATSSETWVNSNLH